MKDAVNMCIITQAGVKDCDSGTNGVPAAYSGPAGSNLGSVSVVGGVIIAIASDNNGLNGQTAVLTPTLASNNSVTWCLTGSSDAGLSASCDAGSGGGSGGGVNADWSGFSGCSGDSCTFNNITYTMWPQAEYYLVGNIDNFMTALSRRSINDIEGNSAIINGVGDVVMFGLKPAWVCATPAGCYWQMLVVKSSEIQDPSKYKYIYGAPASPGGPITYDQTIPLIWQNSLPYVSLKLLR